MTRIQSHVFPAAVVLFLFAGIHTSHAQTQGETKLAQQDSSSLLQPAEMINTGYAEVKRKLYAGAASAVPEAVTKGLSSVSVDSRLQGQAAGLRVINASGAPGSGALNIIRGISTINAGVNPLYIVDGIPVKGERFGNSLARNADNNPLADIDPEDIASITILKDGHATALYGMRGSNGVVVINTYGGTSGKTYLDFSGYTGFMSAPDALPVLNADQYRSYTLEKEQARGFTPAQINNGIGRYILLSTPQSQIQRYNNNTDWQDEIFKNGKLNNVHFVLRGGDAIARYSLAVGYTKIDGAVKGTSFNRFSTRFNLDYKVGKKLSFLNTLAYAQTDKILVDEGSAYNTNPVFLSTVKSPTLTSFVQNTAGENLRDLDSADYAGRNNLYSVMNRMHNDNGSNRILAKIIGQYTFSPYLVLKVGLFADYYRLNENRFRPSAGFLPEGYIIRSSSEGKGIELMALNENVLSYNRSFGGGKHNLSAIIGNSIQSTTQETKTVLAVNAVSDEFTTVGTSDPLRLDSVVSASPRWNLVSFFTNAQYTFNDKIIASINLRADGSSRFAKGNRWGYFPSAALAWRLSNEAFLKGNNVVKDLKLRASYGLSGNQQVGYYNAFNAIVPAPYSNYSSVRFGILGNPHFQWEATRQADMGIDAELLNGRLGFIADFYSRKTDHLYNIIRLPGISGFDNYAVSDGAVRNRGAEFTVWGKPLTGKLGWQSNLNISFNKNTILSLPEKLVTVTDYDNYATIAAPGNAIGAFYGYNAIGIYKNTADVKVRNGAGNANPFKGGDIIFEDVDNNGIIDQNDRKVIGNSNPRFFGGFSNGFSYKSFGLDVLIDFAAGNEVYNAQRAALEAMSNYDNQSVAVLSHWRNEGDVATMPRLLQGDAVGNTRFSSRWVEDGSYLRFKAVIFTYNLPVSGILKRAFKSAKVSLSAQNLYTFSKYKGYNAEVGSMVNPISYGVDYGNLPQLKTFLLGLKLSL